MDELPLPRTARGQKTRQALLDAAEAEFGAKGYAETSVVTITLRASVAHGTFYTYFPSKEAIFAELVRGLSDRLRAEIGEAVAGLHDRISIERTGMLAFFDFVRRHRALYRIVRQAEFVDPELFHWYYSRLAEGYIRGLAVASERGEIAIQDPETVAWCLMGLTDFVGMRFVLWEQEPPPPRVIEALMAFVQKGLAG
jgi:AcrR family transcriptional regulator